MAKRKDTEAATATTATASGTPATEALATSAALLTIETPKIETAEAETLKFEASSDTPKITSSKIELPKAAPTSALAARSLARLHRYTPLAASLAIAAALGAAAGAATTVALTRSPPPVATDTDETRVLKETLVRLDSAFTALKASVDTANRSAGAQFGNLAARLDRAEKAQAEPAARLAKIVESLDRLERRPVAAPVAVAAAQPAPDTTGS